MKKIPEDLAQQLLEASSGALHMVSMKALLTEGEINVEKVAGSVVPQLISGLVTRN